MATQAAVFEYRTDVYYDQLDGQMLLHHPRYFILVERAQQAWIEHILDAPRFDWQNFPDMYVVVRKLEAEYLQSVKSVGEITVKIWPEEIRAATLKMGFEITSNDGEVIYCRGTRLNCKVDLETHAPAMWSDRLRERVESRLESAGH